MLTARDFTREEITNYLEENMKRPGVVTTPSGLQYRVIKSGQGRSLAANDDIVIGVKASLINGKVVIDSGTGWRGWPGMGIPGIVEALKSMRVGDEWELVMAPSLGPTPGNGLFGDTLPHDKLLVIDLTLLKAEPH